MSLNHIDKLSKKIASGMRIGAIKRIKSFVSPEILHYIYNALVQPISITIFLVGRGGGRCVTSQKMAAKETRDVVE